MLKTHSINAFLLLVFVAFSTLTYAQKAYTVNEIPDPKNNGGGWVSNPDSILTPDAVDQINTTISDFEKKTNVQIAVVVVNDFNHDQEDFDFAYKLFNTWGIGQKTSNNGLLLFISKDRRKYRFITGTGAEGVLPDVKLKHIAEQNLLPAFRQNDFGTGIIQTIDALGLIILNPENKSELNQFFTQPSIGAIGNGDLGKIWIPVIIIIIAFFGVFKLVNRQSKSIAPPLDKKSKNKEYYDPALIKGCASTFLIGFFFIFIMIFSGGFGLFNERKLSHIPFVLFIVLAIFLYFRHLFFIARLRNIHIDDKNFLDAVSVFNRKNWWLVIFSPLILITIVSRKVKLAKTAERFKPVLGSKNQEMVRIDRDVNIEGKPFLSAEQRKEEVLKVYDYDIWLSSDHKEHLIKQWPAEEYDNYIECPSCNCRAYKLNQQITTKPPTYSSEGQAKLINECSFCKKTEFIKWVTLAMLVKSKSSSSSSSSSSRSSSSSSSWGGGRSSGGGTGGSW